MKIKIFHLLILDAFALGCFLTGLILPHSESLTNVAIVGLFVSLILFFVLYEVGKRINYKELGKIN